MYEIETKFAYTLETKNNLTKNASFVKKESFTDTYFDTKDWNLISTDIWLRKRDHVWEIKIPQHDHSNINARISDNYKEVVGEENILQELKLSKKLETQFEPKIMFTTTRETYSLPPFTLVFDETDFGHQIGEVEILVKDISLTKQAEEQIEAFCKTHGLVPHSAMGKCVVYMKTHYPKELSKFIKMGIIRSYNI